MATYHAAPDIGKPPPAHTLTDTAEHARRTSLEWFAANPLVLRDGKTRRVPVAETEAAEAELVTQHLPPWRYMLPEELTGAPAAFAKAAEASPRCTSLVILVAGDAVEVRVDGGRIRAWWKGGRTSGVVMAGRKVTLREAELVLGGATPEAAREQAKAEARERALKAAATRAAKKRAAL